MGIEPNYTGGHINGTSWYLGSDTNVGSGSTLAAITDGTSNTVAYSEWVKGNVGHEQARQGRDLRHGQDERRGQRQQPNRRRELPATDEDPWDYKGQYWTSQDTARGGGYWHIITPNKKACNTTTGNLNYGDMGSLIGPSSNHPGGVNMLFLDGSVKFVKESIGPRPSTASPPRPMVRSSTPTPIDRSRHSWPAFAQTRIP